MSDKMREEFEEWFKRDYHPDKTGPYMKDALLYAWKASRAALCVELPDSDDEDAYIDQFDHEGWCAYGQAIDTVKGILDDAGVRYK